MAGRSFWIVIIICASWQTMAQYPCGTRATVEQLKELEKFQQVTEANIPAFKQQDTLYPVPIKFHIVRHTDGTGGLDESKIPQILDTLNAFYKNASLLFEQCDEVNFIDNSSFMGFQPESEEEALTAKTEKPRVLNMYFMDSVFLDGILVCGFAYLPVGDDPKRAYITNFCALNGNTVPHEVGHLFSLLHTHGTLPEGTDELVDGSNCESAGDKLCDTPADPNLAGKVVHNIFQNTCSYTGNERDANGDKYQPDVYNIMSYTAPKCTRRFSNQQYHQILNSYFYHKRTDLFCSPDKPFNENRFLAAYPNPFTNEIFVEYELTGEWPVTLNLYDVAGKRIAKLFAGYQKEGLVRQRFTVGSSYLQHGFYLLQLEIDNGEETYYQKLLRIN